MVRWLEDGWGIMGRGRTGPIRPRSTIRNQYRTEKRVRGEETLPQRNTQHHQHSTRALNEHHRYAERTDHLGFVCVEELRGVLNGCEEGGAYA